MEYIFHLGFVKPISVEEDTDENATNQPSGPEVPEMFVKIQRLIELDTFVATHGPGTYVDGNVI